MRNLKAINVLFQKKEGKRSLREQIKARSHEKKRAKCFAKSNGFRSFTGAHLERAIHQGSLSIVEACGFCYN
jgi:hypothetical protein